MPFLHFLKTICFSILPLLSIRLKSILVFTHMHCSNDLKLDNNFVNSKKYLKLSASNTLFEHYSYDDTVSSYNTKDYTDLDPILEICITDNAKTVEHMSQLAVTADKPQLPSPDQEFMNQLVTESNGDKGN